MLNYFFYDLFFVKYFKDSSKFFFEVIEVCKHCTRVFAIIFLSIFVSLTWVNVRLSL